MVPTKTFNPLARHMPFCYITHVTQTIRYHERISLALKRQPIWKNKISIKGEVWFF